jgi:hypothetical protein
VQINTGAGNWCCIWDSHILVESHIGLLTGHVSHCQKSGVAEFCHLLHVWVEHDITGPSNLVYVSAIF